MASALGFGTRIKVIYVLPIMRDPERVDLWFTGYGIVTRVTEENEDLTMT